MTSGYRIGQLSYKVFLSQKDLLDSTDWRMIFKNQGMDAIFTATGLTLLLGLLCE